MPDVACEISKTTTQGWVGWQLYDILPPFYFLRLKILKQLGSFLRKFVHFHINPIPAGGGGSI